MRHIVPDFLVRDGIISSDAFLLRPKEQALSWRIRRGILGADEELANYCKYHAHVRKKKNIVPGLVGLTAGTLWIHDVFPIYAQEDEYNSKRQARNPYFNLHYESVEPPSEIRHSLASLASNSWLRLPEQQ